MGITVSPTSQPSIQSLNPDGTVGGSEVQQTGTFLGTMYGIMLETQVTVGTVGIGLVLGGLPGGVIGAFLAPHVMDALYGAPNRMNFVADSTNDRILRDLAYDLRGSVGVSALGTPLEYGGTDANLMTRDRGGANISYPSSPTNLKPWVVKLVKKQTMTTRDLDSLGLFMLTIRTDRVTEFIQGIARARVVVTSIPQLPPDLYVAKQKEIYNAACAQLGPYVRAQRDRVRNNLALARAYWTASRKPIDYSRTTVYYTVSGNKRTERWVAKLAIANLAEQDAWGTVQKKVMGRWARAKLTTSALTSSWCAAMAKNNSTKKTFISGQIAAAKLQF